MDALPIGVTEQHGFILVERHVEKNAGSTFREILLRNELHGKCMYWGYQQRSVVWDRFLAGMYNLSKTAPLPRICIEAHSHIDHVTPWLRRLEQLQEMRENLKRNNLNVSVLLLLRIREPVSHYISYYLWTVVERQARKPNRFGTTFAEWAKKVPNLQTELLLSSNAAFTASFAPIGHKDLDAWKARWNSLERASKRRALALRVLGAFDIVGTTARFEETTLLVAQALNWSTRDAAYPFRNRNAAPQAGQTCSTGLLRRRTNQPIPWWCRYPDRDPADEKRRVHHHVCPNATFCQELIRSIAPVDFELHALAEKRLAASIRMAGPQFRVRLHELRDMNRMNRIQEKPRCMWRTRKPIVMGGPLAERNGRRSIYDASPSFERSSKACVTGAQEVMKHIWAEHRKGGRVPPGHPLGILVPYQPGFSSHKGIGADRSRPLRTSSVGLARVVTPADHRQRVSLLRLNGTHFAARQRWLQR